MDETLLGDGEDGPASQPEMVDVAVLDGMRWCENKACLDARGSGERVLPAAPKDVMLGADVSIGRPYPTLNDTARRMSGCGMTGVDVPEAWALLDRLPFPVEGPASALPPESSDPIEYIDPSWLFERSKFCSREKKDAGAGAGAVIASARMYVEGIVRPGMGLSRD